MVKRSEGVKRITLIASILSVIGWISYVALVSDGFSQIKPIGWLLLPVGSVIAYFIPQLIYKTVYWVIDGFNEDKKT
jgi:uncharacterized membrane protein